MASIQWTDAEGAASLSNDLPAELPGSRLQNFRPRRPHIGDVDHALGDRVRYAFTFGEQPGCTFELQHLPAAKMALMDRLARHVAGGGVVQVTTDDSADRVYPTCQLAEGAEPPEPVLSDSVHLEYTMSFALVDVRGAAATPMLCVYE